MARVPCSFLILSTLLSLTNWRPCEGVGIHSEGSDYCYSDPECGPESDQWGETCHNGDRQSPIILPARARPLPGLFSLDLRNYKAGSFRMQNNGHTVHIELLESDSHSFGSGQPLGTQFAFPHPVGLGRGKAENRAYYKFDSAHFHWGIKDNVGSEHCFDDRCFAMELHLVHFLSIYDSMENALESGDPNALAVIGVMLDVTPAAGQGNPVLAPIVNNIFQIEEASHDDWAYINMPLDFTPFLLTNNQNYMYTYKGSLTSPECNEQVNWFVFKRPIAISHQDVTLFRRIRDNNGDQLLENHRPIQPRNGRHVFLAAVKSL